MSREATKLVLGRGEVYFDRFLPGTRRGEGERYLGNTSSFRIQREVERLKRATSYRGLRIDKEDAVIAESHTVNFVTDHVDAENLNLWFGSDPLKLVGLAVENVTENLVVKRGRFYQLGKTVAPIVGLTNLAYTTVHRNGMPVPMGPNYRLDNARGRIEILSDAPDIPDYAALNINFQVPPSNQVMSEADAKSIHGALRFISWNISPSGTHVQNDLYFPMVCIKPRGQVEMKSDEWQQWSFDAEALNLSPAHSQVYITHGATEIGRTSDEQAIVDEFGEIAPFPFWEDELHEVTNYEWPLALSHNINGV